MFDERDRLTEERERGGEGREGVREGGREGERERESARTCAHVYGRLSLHVPFPCSKQNTHKLSAVLKH